MPGLCSDPSLIPSLSIAPGITNLRGSLHFFFTLCRRSSVQKQAYVPCSPYLSLVPAWARSKLPVYSSVADLQPSTEVIVLLLGSRCSWKALSRTTRATGGVSCLLCRHVCGSRSWLWVDPGCTVKFILLLGSKRGVQRRGRAMKCQTQQWPSDFVANHHHV